MELKEVIENRHSVRKFSERDIPDADIREMIAAASAAPSPGNAQGWHFLAIKDKEIIHGISDIVRARAEKAASAAADPDRFLRFTGRFITFFEDAPLVILCLAAQYSASYFNDIVLCVAEDRETLEHYLKLEINPSMQALGAAVENLMLRAVDLGYGTCWQTGPVTSYRDIEEYLIRKLGIDLKEKHIAAVVPVGIPEGEPKSPPKRSADEILTII